MGAYLERFIPHVLSAVHAITHLVREGLHYAPEDGQEPVGLYFDFFVAGVVPFEKRRSDS